ncbi:MAG TPA: M48 family metallopeptidase [candidate division Zixibacteria bacterium]|nr:M48 family metallopeptidase [candidate division Zixibacteria bacterium]
MEHWVVGLFLVFFTLELAVEGVLNELNLRYIRERCGPEGIPDDFRGRLSPEEYRRSVDYALARGRFQRWAEIYGGAVLLAVLFGGILPRVEELARTLAGRWNPAWQGPGVLFCFAVALILVFAGLPTDLYATFGIEARFGFNKTTPGLYLADKAKGLLLGIVLGLPFLWVVLTLMEIAGRFWWLWAFAFILGFQLLMIVVYPTLIAPLFNRFEPLEEGELRDRIEALAARVGFKTGGIYSMDGSKRSAHSNAYFTGIGRAKRIVLFDTLIAQMPVDQTLAVLAHEMGHYKMKHVRRMLVLEGALLFAGLYVLSLLLDYAPFYAAFGLAPSNHAALVLFSLVSGPAVFYLGPLLNYLSRRHEYEADRFAALALGDGRAMEEALVNLTVKNLANLTPHPWYSAYHYSHPTPVERIRAIRGWDTLRRGATAPLSA